MAVEALRVEHTPQALAADRVAVPRLCQVYVARTVARPALPASHLRRSKVVVCAPVAPRAGVAQAAVADDVVRRWRQETPTTSK